MSMGIYKCPCMSIYKCPWVFKNVSGYLSEGDDTFQGVVLLHYSDSHVTVT